VIHRISRQFIAAQAAFAAVKAMVETNDLPEGSDSTLPFPKEEGMQFGGQFYPRTFTYDLPKGVLVTVTFPADYDVDSPA
jgi:hypothetical protein